MPRSNRLFEIIQILRAAKAPLRAADMARDLEVSERTLYRDIAALQGMRVPIEGAAGVGYVMRRGYDLPAVNFDEEEAEAVAVGLAMIARTGDAALMQAATRAGRKLYADRDAPAYLIAATYGIAPGESRWMTLIREALRSEQKLDLHYADVEGQVSKRRICPLALIFYPQTAVLAAWCDLRVGFRHFRLDRILEAQLSGETFLGEAEALRAQWEGLHRAGMVA